MKKILMLVLMSAAMLFSLAACGGESLPEGMDREEVLSDGQQVLLCLVEGDYEEVHAALREDQRAQFTVEDIRNVVTAQLEGAGIYKQIEDRMTTAQTIEDEQYGIAVFYCEFSEEDVLIRVSFDRDGNLVGFSLDQR